MNETTLFSRDNSRESQPRMVRVWDPLVRLLHWSLAASFATAFLTEDDLLALHVWAGYGVLGLIFVRLLWGFVGPRHARWSDFVKEPGEVITYLKDAVRFRAARYLGHNPAGGAMAVALIVSLTATCLTGLAVYGAQELSGPMAPLLSGLSENWAHALEDIHEFLANLTLLLVFLHLAGVALASLQHHENLVRAMITGIKRSETQ
ncbi:MAG: cytochrome b [bacterium]|nr:cytochrome b [bacterium]